MDAIEQGARPRRPGEALAAERERQGLERADIASRLHMSTWQVEALERDDYAKLPRGPFLRGFVRNYAKALGLPPDDILKLLAQEAPREPAPRIVVPTQNIRFDPLSERIGSPYVRAATIAAVAIAFGFAAMYWWLFVRNAPPAATTVARTAEATTTKPAPKIAAVPAPAPATPATAPDPAPATPAPPPSAARTQAPVVAVPPPAPVVEKPRQPEASTVAAAGSGATLKFRFKGKSWVEVRDAGGRVLATGLNDPGSEAEVSGRPPFRVIVGNASEVQMFFNNREFDLEPHVREAVARVTVQ